MSALIRTFVRHERVRIKILSNEKLKLTLSKREFDELQNIVYSQFEVVYTINHIEENLKFFFKSIVHTRFTLRICLE